MATSVIAVVLCIVAVEIALRLFLPFDMTAVSTVGHVNSANSGRYGWGFDPHERIRIQDPNTGEIEVSRANNHGWRDREFANGDQFLVVQDMARACPVSRADLRRRLMIQIVALLTPASG